MASTDSVLDTIELLLETGGERLLSFRHEAEVLFQKSSHADLVSQADLDTEATLLDLIRQRHPSDGIVSEEAGRIRGTSGRTWIIDPLDGTANFLRGSENFGVIVGVWQDAEGIVAGGMFLPAIGRTYLAERNAGATCNGNAIRGSTAATLRDSVLDHSLLFFDDPTFDESQAHTLDAVLQAARGVRCDHSLRYLADTAEGVLDGFVYHSLGLWDIAGPSLILSEAGYTVSDVAGASVDLDPANWTPGRRYRTMAANPAVHAELVQLFSRGAVSG